MKETAYLLQAALISAWWVGLAASPSFFAAFQFAEVSRTAFWSFLAPDILVIAALSALRAYRNISAIELIVLGAFGYAAVYCCNATLLTGTGLLPTGLMLLGLAYNILLCFNRRLFRSSRTTNVRVNAAKTLIQIFCIWLLALGVVPYVLLDSFHALAVPPTGLSLWLGCGMFLGFGLLGLTSSYFMVRDGSGTPLPLDQTNHLVTSGPYRYVRNPMAIAGIGQGLALATIFHSAAILVYALLGAFVWHLVVRPIEERDLAERFGEAYSGYREQVTCWIPRLPQHPATAGRDNGTPMKNI